MLKSVVLNILLGVIMGLVEYFIYFKIPLSVLTDYFKIPVTLTEPLRVGVILGVFIALNIISSNIKPPVGLVFDALSHLLGLLIVFRLVFGTLEAGRVKVAPRIGEFQVEAELEFTPLVTLLVGFAVLFVIIRLYEKIVHYEE